MKPELLLFWADVLLVIHVVFVAFVIFGHLLILVGWGFRWNWIKNPWFRTLHLLAIGVVVLQAWLGIICPLTIWEMELREKAGAGTYSGSFIAHWLGELLYYEAPLWVFTLAYTLFGLSVVAAWWWVRPLSFRRKAKGAG